MIYDALFAGLVWVKNACIGQNTPHEALLITNGWFRNMKSESQICRSSGDIFLIVDVLVSIMRGRLDLECRRLWLRDAIRVSAARPLCLCRAINYWAWTEYSHSEERMPDCETHNKHGGRDISTILCLVNNIRCQIYNTHWRSWAIRSLWQYLHFSLLSAKQTYIS